MSIERTTYTLIGYDLSAHRKEILTDDFEWSKEWEDLTYYQSKGHIQLFTDPMGDCYLYFGYIVGSIDEYDDSTVIRVNFDEDEYKEILSNIDSILEKIYAGEKPKMRSIYICGMYLDD